MKERKKVLNFKLSRIELVNKISGGGLAKGRGGVVALHLISLPLSPRIRELPHQLLLFGVTE